MGKKTIIIPIFVPHLGCPHECVFCDQKIISERPAAPSPTEVTGLIKEYLGNMKEQGRVEVAFYGGTFTALPLDQQEELLQAAVPFWQAGLVAGLRISTRPDYIDPERLSFLIDRGVQTIELGVQSLNPLVLAASGRGHDPETVCQAAKLIKDRGLQLGIQLMLGLPGDSYQTTLDTARQVVDLAPDFVRIYPTLVLQGTTLERLYRAGKYHPLPLETAVELARDLVILFWQNRIEVIRVGLQATATFDAGDQLVAGPYHPAFGEMVYAAYFLEQMAMLAGRLLGQHRVEQLTFLVAPRDLSAAIGQKKYNKVALAARYHLTKIDILAEPTLTSGTICLKNDTFTAQLCISKEEFLASCRI